MGISEGTLYPGIFTQCVPGNSRVMYQEMHTLYTEKFTHYVEGNVHILLWEICTLYSRILITQYILNIYMST